MDSLKFFIEEAMTSQKRDDVIAFFDAIRNFFGQKGHRPPKSEDARTPRLKWPLILHVISF